MKKWRFTIIMAIIGFGCIFGFYGWYIPSYLEEHQSEQKEVIEMSGMTPVEQTGVSGWSGTTTWTVTKPDSLGNPVEKTVDVRFIEGAWSVQPH